MLIRLGPRIGFESLSLRQSFRLVAVQQLLDAVPVGQHADASASRRGPHGEAHASTLAERGASPIDLFGRLTVDRNLEVVALSRQPVTNFMRRFLLSLRTRQRHYRRVAEANDRLDPAIAR